MVKNKIPRENYGMFEHSAALLCNTKVKVKVTLEQATKAQIEE
jgi:hypothetical protein